MLKSDEMMDSGTVPPGVEQNTSVPNREGVSRRWVWILILLLLIAGVYFGISRIVEARRSAAQAAAAAAAAHAGVPVAATAAKRGDLNRFLTAIGSVTAFNTVTV